MDTTIGERIAPTIVIVTIVIATHMLCTCVGHPQNPLLPPSPQPVICVYCVVQSIGRWSAKNRPQDNREEGHIPAQYPVGTPETDNGNLPQCLVTVHIKPMLGPKIAKKLGPQATNRGDQRQADNTNNHHNAPHRANQIIKIIFLTGIIGIVTGRDKHVLTRSKIKGILHITLPFPCTVCRLRLA